MLSYDQGSNLPDPNLCLWRKWISLLPGFRHSFSNFDRVALVLCSRFNLRVRQTQMCHIWKPSCQRLWTRTENTTTNAPQMHENQKLGKTSKMTQKSCAWTHFGTFKTPAFRPSKRRLARAWGSKRCSFLSSRYTDPAPVKKNTISLPKTVQKWFKFEDRMQNWRFFWTFGLVTQDHIFKSLKHLGRGTN